MNYDEQCWYCGSRSMESKGSYSLCTQCGATYNNLPTGGVLPVIIVGEKTGRHPRVGEATAYRPHGRVARQAKRARERSQK